MTISITSSVGSRGRNLRQDVITIQTALNNAGAQPPLERDGDCGPLTVTAIVNFQGGFLRNPDGRVDPGGTTLRHLNNASGGQPAPTPPSRPGNAADDWPARPTFGPIGLQRRIALFGSFAFEPAATTQDPDAIRITDNWPAENIVTVQIPQLVGVPTYFGNSRGRVRWHRLAAAQLSALWAAWQGAGLIDRVLFWGGSYVPRFMRGSARNGAASLSNHSWGTAFDINVRWNGLNRVPARLGEEGCVRELVQLANDHGFYWGGHFNRQDGMHFEIAQVQ